MKSALIHDWLNGMRGGEKVLEDVLELFPGSPVFTLFYEPDRVSEKIRTRKVVPSILQKFPGSHKNYRRLLPLYPWAVKRFDLSGCDLIFSISHCAAKAIPKPSGAVHICYCLTPMRYIWDKFEDYFGKERCGAGVRSLMRLMRPGLQKWDVKTAENVDFFIATSSFIQERIKKYYGRESEIIHPPVNTNFFHPGNSGGKAKEREPYYLAVTALAPYKRMDIGIEAFRGRSEQLIIAGSGPEEEDLKKRAPENVIFRGWVSDEELRELYRGCEALIFPPEEDFGLAPLEAAACGRPSIAYGSGGALETVTEGVTGLFFEQQSPASLSESLDRFRSHTFDPEKIRIHAEKFSRGNFLKQLREYLKEKVDVGC